MGLTRQRGAMGLGTGEVLYPPAARGRMVRSARRALAGDPDARVIHSASEPALTVEGAGAALLDIVVETPDFSGQHLIVARPPPGHTLDGAGTARSWIIGTLEDPLSDAHLPAARRVGALWARTLLLGVEFTQRGVPWRALSARNGVTAGITAHIPGVGLYGVSAGPRGVMWRVGRLEDPELHDTWLTVHAAQGTSAEPPFALRAPAARPLQALTTLRRDLDAAGVTPAPGQGAARLTP